jgi:hypothetical protein
MEAVARQHRVFFDDSQWLELERQARWLKLPTSSLVRMVIADAIRKWERDGFDPLEQRFSPAAAGELVAPVRHPDR